MFPIGGEGGRCRLRNVGSEWPLTCFRHNHMWPWLMVKSYSAASNLAAGVLRQHSKGTTPAVGSKRNESRQKLYFCHFWTRCVLAGRHLTGPQIYFGSVSSADFQKISPHFKAWRCREENTERNTNDSLGDQVQCSTRCICKGAARGQWAHYANKCHWCHGAANYTNTLTHSSSSWILDADHAMGQAVL